MQSRIEQLTGLIRRSPLFLQIAPPEAGFGWPLPLRRNGRVYVTLPLFNYAPFGDGRATLLFPPFATLTVDWGSAALVEFALLRFRTLWPESVWQQPAGTFPHPAIAGLKHSDYLARRRELLRMYEESLDALQARRGLPAEWERCFRQALSELLEPPLLPYYRALAPKFVDYWLPAASDGV